jgi:protein involved in polysaccharide export with SLBB domain
MRQPGEPYILPRNDRSQRTPDLANNPNPATQQDLQPQTPPDDQQQPNQLSNQPSPNGAMNPRQPNTPRGGSSTLASAQDEEERDRRQPRTEVEFFAPEIDWDYAVIERLDRDTLKTRLIPFDLGRLVLQHDSGQDLELQAGDVVTIFSGDDIRLPIAEQNKIVKLDGEFVHAGSYTVEPGETLRDLVQRAGGFTSGAYLYGSEFSRESTRKIQQTRLDEYIRNLQIQVQHGTLSAVASAVSSAQDIAGSAAAQNAEQDMIAQLKMIRATGRIVLEFSPGSSGMNEVPEIALENGDRFLVPSRPASVNVVGAVYDQNSFLFSQSRQVGAYLHLAGGPNRSADEKHEFIIRANGEVLSRDSVDNAWKRPFMGVPLNPGDTLVVPEKVFKQSTMRMALEWSQLFSQLALGAAAIGVLK